MFVIALVQLILQFVSVWSVFKGFEFLMKFNMQTTCRFRVYLQLRVKML